MPADYARALWTLFEPIHALTYFAPEARAAYADAGLHGFWRGYFAGRAAPLGAVGPGPVVAVFAGFAPDMVARAVPAVWELTPPEQALEVRRDGAVAALRRALADVPTAEVEAAAHMLGAAASDLPPAGRALGAANAALPVPDDPYAILWQAATTLREHRGDGHVAAQVTSGIAGLDALVLRAGADLSRDLLQPNRGWTDEQWDASAQALTGRRLLDQDGRTTADGRAVLDLVEAVTDFTAGTVWADPQRAVTTGLLLAPLARACLADLPQPNPIGTWTQWDPASDPGAESQQAG